MDAAPLDPAEDPAYELLGLLGEELASGDIDNRLVAAEGLAPAQLVIPLVADGGEVAVINLCFLPEHDLPAVLQYIVALEYDVAPDAVETTARFLHMVNSSLPLTGFELGESVSAVVFRYLQPVSVQPLVTEVVLWPLSMIFHAVTRFSPLIARACAGASMDELVSGYGLAMAELYRS
ncbi:hypothetical protein ASC77_03990 [Nocardioides sp. Root1257]|uniref:hypothetical protein n=1 Tax=unclassified Nocardioides TaxID=2615069 RepID=UPI0007006761|nr:MULTISPECIES: hypothetical protein [unclassified Nocardioides]KQW53452.1 hypothetical protein ASC77_03990 [Nocardioides sp. Root1257]KRC56138.1 hypothetical protein ASE24_03990 [Nocardioides sp. Root224]